MQFLDTNYSFQTMQYQGMFGSIFLPIEDVTAAQVCHGRATDLQMQRVNPSHID